MRTWFVLWSVTVLSVACTTEEPPPVGDMIDTTDDAVDAMADTTSDGVDTGGDVADTNSDDDANSEPGDANLDANGGDAVEVDPCEGETFESLRARYCTYEIPVRCEFGINVCSYEPNSEGIDFCECQPGANGRWVWLCTNHCNL